MEINYTFLHSTTDLHPDDLERMNSLMRQLSQNPVEITVAHVNEILRDCDFLVARDGEAGGRIVAMACLAHFTTTTGGHGRIEDVIVDEAYRGQRIGWRMMELLLDAARKRSLRNVSLTTRPERVAANQLYQRLGFQQVHTNVYRLILDQ